MVGEVPRGEPALTEEQKTLKRLHERALNILNERRVKLDDSFVGKQRTPGNPEVYTKEEVRRDESETRRLKAAYEQQHVMRSPPERAEYEENKSIADILEALFAETTQQMFGDNAEVIVPAAIDDYKRAADMLVVFRDDAGKIVAPVLVDFTTQKDIDGYTEEDGHRGGLASKWQRSLSPIAAKNSTLPFIKYGAGSKGERQQLRGPRVLVGLSKEEVIRMALLAEQKSLALATDVNIQSIAHSIQKQLVVQMHLALKNGKKGASERIKRCVVEAQRHAKKVSGRLPESIDPVITQINSMLAPSNRDAQYKEAAEKQKAFEDAQVGKPKVESNTPLTDEERARILAHCSHVDPSGNLHKQFLAWQENKPHTLTKESLLLIAGGMPLRVWMQLENVVAAQHQKPKDPTTPHLPHDKEKNETPHSQLDAAAHLALLKKASGITEEKYAKLDTRGKRIWSFIKEKGIRALVAGVGAAIGSTFALAMCAGALPSMLVAFGGAVAGSLLGGYLLKKYYYDKHPDKDHTKDRARAAVIQSLARWAKENPYSFAQYYGGSHGEVALKKTIERKVFLRNFAGNALAAGVGTVAGLEVRTGGQFTKTLLSGDFDALWKLFYCAPLHSNAPSTRGGMGVVPIDGRGAGSGQSSLGSGRAGSSNLYPTPRNSLGRGMQSAGAMYTFETPRGRLPAWMHQQCIGRCNTTAPFGYHSWVPGRIGSGGQQLYQLKYTPR